MAKPLKHTAGKKTKASAGKLILPNQNLPRPEKIYGAPLLGLFVMRVPPAKVKTHSMTWLGRCKCGAPANVRVQTVLREMDTLLGFRELKTVGYLVCEECATRQS